VLPGDKLLIEIWCMGIGADGWEELRFTTRVEGGKVCLKSGRAIVIVVESPTNLDSTHSHGVL
jgi:hypothetical protein